MISRRHALRAGLPAVLAVAALAILLVPDSAPEPHTAALENSVPGSAALRAAIDPETGALAVGTGTPDKNETPELSQMLSRSTEGLRQEALPGGGYKVDLQGRFMSASVARVDADGNVETLCTEDLEAAESFLATSGDPERDAHGREVR